MSYKLTIAWEEPTENNAMKSFFDKVVSISGVNEGKYLVIEFSDGSTKMYKRDLIKEIHMGYEWEE